jgi:hypothetical protein
VTAVADMGTSIEDWQAYRRAGDKNQLYVRIMAYAMGIDQMALIAGASRRRGSMPTGCAWAGSSCSWTARSVRAGPGSRRPMPMRRPRGACRA